LKTISQGGLVRETFFGAHGAVTNCRKCAFDDFPRAQMPPVLGREVVEGQQCIALLAEAFDCFLVFNTPGFYEAIGNELRWQNPPLLRSTGNVSASQAYLCCLFCLNTAFAARPLEKECERYRDTWIGERYSTKM
jgi:hypothetical protein